MNKVFFSENGLTSTSANHLCNIAKEYIQSIQTRLNSISFIDKDVKLIGSNDRSQIELGVDSVDWVERALDTVSKVKSLIAWLREAIKEKENATKELNNYNFNKYLEDNGIELPTIDRGHVLTEEEYYNSLPIKERNRYYQLETCAAVIGKYIHPEGHLAVARERLKDKLNNPTEVDKNGRDTLIFTYTPSISCDDVDDLFFALQNKHRSIQAQLNQMKHECEEAIMVSREEDDDLAKKQYIKYEDVRAKAFNDYSLYLDEKRRELKKLKIVIPDSLKEIYEHISNIGK